MKKIVSLMLLFFSLFTLTSCKITINKNPGEDTDSSNETYEISGEVFRLSSIVDTTDDNGVASYAVRAPYTDTYEIKCTKSSKIVIYDNETVIKNKKE